jgi:hypothetical protein
MLSLVSVIRTSQSFNAMPYTLGICNSVISDTFKSLLILIHKISDRSYRHLLSQIELIFNFYFSILKGLNVYCMAFYFWYDPVGVA